jgi:protein-S-isoprenylcysteine O-methyltransferase Ste14
MADHLSNSSIRAGFVNLPCAKKMRIVPRVILIFQGLFMMLIAVSAVLRIAPIDLPLEAGYFGMFLDVLGFVCVVVSALTLRANFTVSPQPKNALLTSGIYRLSRNPIYLGALLMALGFTLIFGSGLTLISTIGLWIILREKIKMEEYFLQRKFGESYLNYQKKTRRWL